MKFEHLTIETMGKNCYQVESLTIVSAFPSMSKNSVNRNYSIEANNAIAYHGFMGCPVIRIIAGLCLRYDILFAIITLFQVDKMALEDKDRW